MTLILQKTPFLPCYFLLPKYRESIVLGQIFKVEILMDLQVLRSPESENHIFRVCSVGMCVCVCLCVCPCVCVSVISLTQKQITAEASNFLFYIYIMYRCYLKLFIKIGQKLCVQGHTKEYEYIKDFGRNFLLLNFCIFRLH